MANFRVERLFIRVSGTVEFDPNLGIDAEEFAFLAVVDQGALDRPPLSEFMFAPFERARWFAVSQGLTVVRGLIADFERRIEHGDELGRAIHVLEKKLQTLRTVEDRLDMIDVQDLKFHLLAKDLGD